MKIFKNLFLGILLLFTIVSCKKSQKSSDAASKTDDPKKTEEPKKAEATMTATIDGKSYTFLEAAANKKSSGFTAILGSVDPVKGVAEGSINISIETYTGVKSYSLGGTKYLAVWSIGNPLVNYFNLTENTGVLNITKDDGEFVEGNFNFTAKGANDVLVKVTEGKFRAKIKNQ